MQKSDIGDDFVGHRFGADNQLVVLGWFGELAGSNKKYTVKCSRCAEDSELYGSGEFLITKSKIIDGRLPCGCSKAPKRTKEQYEILVKRACFKDNYKFLGWDGDFSGVSSRIIVECPCHNIRTSKVINDFLAGGRRCIELRREKVKKTLLQPEEDVIKRFFDTGSFHEDTVFRRSERAVPHKSYREGVKPYWFVTCGDCGESFETLYSTLIKGGMSCGCFRHKQRLSYINGLYDNETIIAIKVGITSTVSKRERQQSLGCIFSIKSLGVWKFNTVTDCKAAESEVKTTLPCGVINKVEMKDGHTETLSTAYIDEVIRIYEKHGGFRL